jgi:hypothetical protein
VLQATPDTNVADPPAPASVDKSDGSSSDEHEAVDAGSGHKQRDKEWAALTTWLRMNLHHVSACRLLLHCLIAQLHATVVRDSAAALWQG